MVQGSRCHKLPKCDLHISFDPEVFNVYKMIKKFKSLIIIEHFVCVRHHSKNFIYNLFNSHKNPMRWVVLTALFYR